MNMPVTLGGLVIHPGDIILADESGALVVPAQKSRYDCLKGHYAATTGRGNSPTSGPRGVLT